MARTETNSRKRRTRQHVIADLSVNHVERFILEAGYTVQRMDHDYGYDLQMTSYDDQGYLEAGVVYFQLKGSDQLTAVGENYVFDLDVRDYNLWMIDPMPVVMVLYDARKRRACWLDVQDYFRDQVARQPKPGAKTVRVRVPQRQTLSRRTMLRLRSRKQEVSVHWALKVIHG